MPMLFIVSHTLKIGYIGCSLIYWQAYSLIVVYQDTSLSDRKILRILTHIRKNFGRAAITPGIHTLLVKRKTMLDQFFKTETSEFEVKDQGVTRLFNGC